MAMKGKKSSRQLDIESIGKAMHGGRLCGVCGESGREGQGKAMHNYEKSR